MVLSRWLVRSVNRWNELLSILAKLWEGCSLPPLAMPLKCSSGQCSAMCCWCWELPHAWEVPNIAACALIAGLLLLAFAKPFASHFDRTQIVERGIILSDVI